MGSPRSLDRLENNPLASVVVTGFTAAPGLLSRVWRERGGAGWLEGERLCLKASDLRSVGIFRRRIIGRTERLAQYVVIFATSSGISAPDLPASIKAFMRRLLGPVAMGFSSCLLP